MTQDEIVVSESIAASSVEVHITEARPAGFMAWYRYADHEYFNHVCYLPDQSLSRDYYRCPYPMFPSKQDAIEAAKFALHGRSGEIRIVQVTL